MKKYVLIIIYQFFKYILNMKIKFNDNNKLRKLRKKILSLKKK